MAAKRPPRAQIAWSQVKAKLSDFDHVGLIALLQDLYAASKENQAFLHSRFGLGRDPLEPYKRVIARSLWPDWNQPASIAAAKKAISGYRKAKGRTEDMAELMISSANRRLGSFATRACKTRTILTPSCACTDVHWRLSQRCRTQGGRNKSNALAECASFAVTSAAVSAIHRGKGR